MSASGGCSTLRALLLTAAISLALCLLGLEAYVRLFLSDEVDTEVLRQGLEGASIRSIAEPSPDPVLFFELRPHLHMRFHDAWVITGPARYRVAAADAVAPEPSGGARSRIAVLGDSTSFGWGVEYEDSYPERYRRRLAELTGASIELRNYSVPGYNALQELRAFETKVRAYRPNLLILHHDHNDADPTIKSMGADYMPAEYGDNPLHSALLKWSLRRLRRMRSVAGVKGGNRYVGGYVAAGPLYDAHLEARRALVEQARAMGTLVIVVIFNAFVVRDSDYTRKEVYTVLHRDLGVRLERMGYHVLDLYPLYQSALQERGWPDLSAWRLSPADGHPNAEGHQFIADRLVEYTLQDERLSAVFGRGGER